MQQVKFFHGDGKQPDLLTEKINSWLKSNPRITIVERQIVSENVAVSRGYSHGGVYVAIWYLPESQ